MKGCGTLTEREPTKPAEPFVIRLTKEERHLLIGCLENGWGDGEYGESLESDQERTLRRALVKVGLRLK